MPATLSFAGQTFHAAGHAALYWPAQKCLLVSDLHLEKGSSYAESSGQMLPPYDSAATLQDIAALMQAWNPAQIICLGDNFHDSRGEERLTGQGAEMLMQMTAQAQWHWIVGNHDPDIGSAGAFSWGGTVHREYELAGVMLRHEIDAADSRPEISGHYHPKLRVSRNTRIRGRSGGRAVSRRCFLISGKRMVMPAFGALTGGMDAGEVAALMPGAPDMTEETAAWVVASGKFARFALADA